jgi:hypothetical protein
MKQIVNELNLKFERNIEKEYLGYIARKDSHYIRVSFLLFAILYGMFSITDYYMVPQWFSLFFMMRFYIVIPILLLTIVLTFLPQYEKWKQFAILFSYIIGGLSIVVMLALEPLNIMYYGGLFLVFTSAYFMLNLNFELVVLGGIIILSGLIIGMALSNNLNLTIWSAILFLIAQNIIGTIGAYQIEQYRRNEFVRVYDLENVQRKLNSLVSDKTEEITKAQVSTIVALARLAESRDKLTGEHVERVGELCYKLAMALPIGYFDSLNQKSEFTNVIRLASSLHDIGKVGISDSILNKAGQLTPYEYNIMKTHVNIGAEILAKLYEEYPNNAFVRLGIEITKCHHEKWDGSGYPSNLQGEEIPLSARIMALVDVYDALISKRPYKDAMSHDEAMHIIINDSGKHFDPDLVQYFRKIF